MSYYCGIGPGMASAPRHPAIVCDGCGLERPVAPGRPHVVPPAWFLDGKPPPGWRGLRVHDGSKRWDLCPDCWRGPSVRKAAGSGDT